MFLAMMIFTVPTLMVCVFFYQLTKMLIGSLNNLSLLRINF